MPPWKVSRKSSITNRTSVYGDMGGIVNSRSVGVSSRNRASTKNNIPSDPIEGFNYMVEHQLLSKNPVGSGGVHPVGPYLGNRSLGGGESNFEKMSDTQDTHNHEHTHTHTQTDRFGAGATLATSQFHLYGTQPALVLPPLCYKLLHS